MAASPFSFPVLSMPQVDDFNIRWKCIHCGVQQKVYMGDPEDFTLPDREAVRCCACKKLEFIGGKEEEFAFRCVHGLEDDQPITEAILQEHAYIEDGEPI